MVTKAKQRVGEGAAGETEHFGCMHQRSSNVDDSRTLFPELFICSKFSYFPQEGDYENRTEGSTVTIKQMSQIPLICRAQYA